MPEDRSDLVNCSPLNGVRTSCRRSGRVRLFLGPALLLLASCSTAPDQAGLTQPLQLSRDGSDFCLDATLGKAIRSAQEGLIFGLDYLRVTMPITITGVTLLDVRGGLSLSRTVLVAGGGVSIGTSAADGLMTSAGPVEGQPVPATIGKPAVVGTESTGTDSSDPRSWQLVVFVKAPAGFDRAGFRAVRISYQADGRPYTADGHDSVEIRRDSCESA